MYSTYLCQVMTMDELVENLVRLRLEIGLIEPMQNNSTYQALIAHYALLAAELGRREDVINGRDAGQVMRRFV